MTSDFQDINPNHLAAILYRPEDDVDALLADFAAALLRDGEHIGGVVQRNLKDDAGRSSGMHVVDLSTGRQISICQPLGTGATACKLDPAGLAEASLAVSRAVAENAALIIVNKFSKQEATGHGLRSELAEAIIAGGPVLTAVPEKCLMTDQGLTDQGLAKPWFQSAVIWTSGTSSGSGMSSPSSSARSMPLRQKSPSSMISLIGVSARPWQGPMKQCPVSRSNCA